jgi:trehalose 6-phosphate phosphatase
VSRRLHPALARLREDPARAGIYLDFDGTLADIVARPEQARAVAGALDLLPRLVTSYGLVAVVSGRPASEVATRVAVPGVQVFGLYGLDRERDDAAKAARPGADLAAAMVEGAWVEDKGASLAIHYRQAPDPEAARRRLEKDLGPLAQEFGLALLPGKRVLELAPADVPGKGDVIVRTAVERALGACLYAGDDVADLAAFRALDELASKGLTTVKVAVRANETPDDLVDQADVVVDRPSGLVALLTELVL